MTLPPTPPKATQISAGGVTATLITPRTIPYTLSSYESNQSPQTPLPSFLLSGYLRERHLGSDIESEERFVVVHVPHLFISQPQVGLSYILQLLYLMLHFEEMCVA